METLTTVDYAKHYGFSLTDDLLRPKSEDLRQAIREEDIPKRRKLFLAAFSEQVTVERLGLEPITLSWLKYGEVNWYGSVVKTYIIDQKYYLGGLRHKIRSVADEGKWGVTERKASYIGPLPMWVRTKYNEARQVIPDEFLPVVSRQRAFFQMDERSLRLGSPLLLAYMPALSQFYLVCAWGLEYELEEATEPDQRTAQD